MSLATQMRRAAAGVSTASSTVWSQDFTGLGSSEVLNGTSPDAGPGTWSAGTYFKGTSSAGNGLYVASNNYALAASLTADAKLYGRNFSGTLHVVGHASAAGRTYRQTVMATAGQAQMLSVGFSMTDGKLGILVVTTTDGTRYVNGSTNSPDATATNELTWTYNATTKTLTLTSSYDEITATLSANEQSDLDTAGTTQMGLWVDRGYWNQDALFIGAEMSET